ncbi:hypothetical protein [Allokutzneria oryzae]|uniref:Uncharacterized protein n=1 Tax=Allokutzneria oryzae TaxID=1378989 RepID=A0ABV6A7E1_9PSEU
MNRRAAEREADGVDWLLTLLGQVLISLGLLLPLVRLVPRSPVLPIALAIGGGLLLVDEFVAAFGQPWQLAGAAGLAVLGGVLWVLIGRLRGLPEDD